MPKTTNPIRIRVSEQVIRFRPGGPPATFDVEITNLSDQFASFQLELEAHGADADAPHNWYRLSPEVSTKKPPGDRTAFQVAITQTPVPGFVGTMNLTVRVSSLELRQEERQILRLMLDASHEVVPLRIELPARHFQAHPKNLIEIPIHLFNPGQLPAAVTLRLTGLEASWLVRGAEAHLNVSPGSRGETTFLCQLPAAAQCPSRIYTFVVEATQPNGPANIAEGAIEVVPTGFVEFSCTPNSQNLPSERRWLLDRHNNTARFQAQFENQSNLPQQVTVEVREGEQQQKFNWTVTPDAAELPLGETVDLQVAIQRRRPWLGLARRALFEVKAVTSDTRLNVRNNTQVVRVQVQSVIPFWLQILGGLGLLWVIWALSWFNPNSPFFGHEGPVNSLQLDGTADQLISGGDDQHIFRWRVAGFFVPWLNQQMTHMNTEKSVRVVRYRPVDNDLIAAGLENGEVQLWSATGDDNPLGIAGRNSEPLKRFIFEQADRVLGLAFSRDARYLFSGHGSGLVLQWDVQQAQAPLDLRQVINQPVRSRQFNLAIYALVIGGDNGNWLAIAGRYNRLLLWNWRDPQSAPVPLPYPAGSQDDYIFSLDTADYQPTLLAVSDNRGRISLYDLAQCQTGNCQPLDQWRAHGDRPIYSVSFSPNGCYLASAGDDGRVMLWALSRDGRRSPEATTGREILNSRKRWRSVSLGKSNQQLIVAAGGDSDNEVQVRRLDEFNRICQ